MRIGLEKNLHKPDQRIVKDIEHLINLEEKQKRAKYVKLETKRTKLIRDLHAGNKPNKRPNSYLLPAGAGDIKGSHCIRLFDSFSRPFMPLKVNKSNYSYSRSI